MHCNIDCVETTKMQGEFQYSAPRKYFMSTKKDIFRRESSTGIGQTPRGISSSESTADGFVGFSHLLQQVYRREVRRGFEFTLMVVGESGLGKSTFINNLFLADIYGSDHCGPSHRVKKTVDVEQTRVHLVENGIHLYLNVVDVPGFGDRLNNTGCWMPIAKFIEDRHRQYLEEQTRIERSFITDTRVHCCLYFISPWGYGLKPLDIQVLKSIHDRVNIIPVIAKGDIFTADECTRFKEAVMKQIEENDIKIYNFPTYGTGDEISSSKEKLLFAVMGSSAPLDPEGRKGRCRRYPWGTAEVENTEHCDFIAIRNLLIRTHMHHLKVATDNNFQLYRFRLFSGNEEERKEYAIKIESEKRSHERKLRHLAEEMENVFDRRIAEKLLKLKRLEDKLEQRCQQMADALKRERLQLVERRAAFETKRMIVDER